MPTVEADVAFGLGKFNIANDEITSRVADALDAVGMYEYLQVCQNKLYIFKWCHELSIFVHSWPMFLTI